MVTQIKQPTSFDVSKSVATKVGTDVKDTFTVDQDYKTESQFMSDMVTGIVAFIVTAVVGLIVLSEFYGSVDTTGTFSGVFDSVESTVSNVYSILLVLPIVAVGAAAIALLNNRLKNGR